MFTHELKSVLGL